MASKSVVSPGSSGPQSGVLLLIEYDSLLLGLAGYLFGDSE